MSIRQSRKGVSAFTIWKLIRLIGVLTATDLINAVKLMAVKTPIGLVNFYIVKADTPFLLCLVDMDRLQVYYNNIIDTLIGFITALKNKYITLLII